MVCDSSQKIIKFKIISGDSIEKLIQFKIFQLDSLIFNLIVKDISKLVEYDDVITAPQCSGSPMYICSPPCSSFCRDFIFCTKGTKMVSSGTTSPAFSVRPLSVRWEPFQIFSVSSNVIDWRAFGVWTFRVKPRTSKYGRSWFLEVWTFRVDLQPSKPWGLNVQTPNVQTLNVKTPNVQTLNV